MRLRNIIFSIYFYSWTIICAAICMPLALFSRIAGQKIITLWFVGTQFGLELIAGIKLEIRGKPPEGPAFFVAKHQSAWETIAMPTLCNFPSIVLKRELLWIPLYGQCIRHWMIPVDRAAGAKALRNMHKMAAQAVSLGRSILIFPQGTRVTPGQPAPYHVGTAALYQLGLPCVPIALNTGYFWPRRRGVVRSGTIIVEFLPPITPGLSRREFMAKIEEVIESASDRLAPP